MCVTHPAKDHPSSITDLPVLNFSNSYTKLRYSKLSAFKPTYSQSKGLSPTDIGTENDWGLLTVSNGGGDYDGGSGKDGDVDDNGFLPNVCTNGSS